MSRNFRNALGQREIGPFRSEHPLKSLIFHYGGRLGTVFGAGKSGSGGNGKELGGNSFSPVSSALWQIARFQGSFAMSYYWHAITLRFLREIGNVTIPAFRNLNRPNFSSLIKWVYFDCSFCFWAKFQTRRSQLNWVQFQFRFVCYELFEAYLETL